MRLAVLIVLLSVAAPAIAQEQDHEHHMAATPGWQWSVEGSVFFGYNYQYRKFTDFDEVESQNWVMTALQKSSGASTLHLMAMFSLEPFTLRDIGSPQVFQTGETFKGAPLIDYQHPHDLIMNLGGEYLTRLRRDQGDTRGLRRRTGAARSRGVHASRLGGGESSITARAPLPRFDCTSRPALSRSACAKGIRHRGRRVSRPRAGRRIDSISIPPRSIGTACADRGRTVRGRCKPRAPLEDARAQIAVRRKSHHGVGIFFRGDEQHSIAWTAAFGQNRDVFGNLEAYLLEGTKRIGKHALYTRIEYDYKDILDAGFHPIGIKHIHRQSPVGALTLGYVRDVAAPSWGTFGVGGDITGYLVPANLEESYGAPLSFHVFVHYRGRAGTRMQHVH